MKLEANFSQALTILGLILYFTLGQVISLPNYHFYDSARIFQLVLLSTVILAYISSNIGLKSKIAVTPRLEIFAVAVLLLSCIIHSVYPYFAIIEISHLLALIILALAVRNLTSIRMNSIWVWVVFSSQLLLAEAFTVAFLASILNELPFQWNSPFLAFSNVRFFNQYQVLTLPLGALALLYAPRRYQLAIWVVATAWWTLHFATASRSAWLAVLCSSAIVLLFLRDHAKYWLRIQGLAAFLGGIFYFVMSGLFDAPGITSVVERGYTDTSRWLLWEYALEDIAKSPILGVGPMHYAFFHGNTYSHPHNAWLQIAAEWGLPLATALIFVLFSAARRVVSYIKGLPVDSPKTTICIALFAALVGGFIDSLFSGSINMPLTQTTLAFLAGWLSANMRPQFEVRQNRARLSNWLLGSAAIACLVILGINAVAYIDSVDPFVESVEYYYPRYWVDGHWRGI